MQKIAIDLNRMRGEGREEGRREEGLSRGVRLCRSLVCVRVNIKMREKKEKEKKDLSRCSERGFRSDAASSFHV